MTNAIGFWAKPKKVFALQQGGSNPLKVDAVFATDDSGSMNSYLNWEDDPSTIDVFNKALIANGIGVKDVEGIDDNNANRISRTFFAQFKSQVIAELALVRVSGITLSSSWNPTSLPIGQTVTITRGGSIVGNAGDFVIYSWDTRTDFNDPSITYNEIAFQGASNQDASTLPDIEVGDVVTKSNGGALGTVAEVIVISNPYRFYVSGDLRLRYFWAKRAGPSGSYQKNSSGAQGGTGANSEDAFNTIEKTIGTDLNCTTDPSTGITTCDGYNPRSAAKLVFVGNTNEHDTSMDTWLDKAKKTLLDKNGVYIGNIGGYTLNYDVGIFPHYKQAPDYNGTVTNNSAGKNSLGTWGDPGTNGVPAADARGFIPIRDYVQDLVVDSFTTAGQNTINLIPTGWYRGVKFDLKTANSSDSAAIQARTRAQIRCDVKVDFVFGTTGNKTLTIRKVVFPGYGFSVGDTLTPNAPASGTTTFSGLKDEMILKVTRVNDINYKSASTTLFSGIYTKDFNRIVMLNEYGPVTGLSIVQAGKGYGAATGLATFFAEDDPQIPTSRKSGFNNKGEGTGLTVNLASGNIGTAGAVTGTTVNAAGTIYNVGDQIILAHPDTDANRRGKVLAFSITDGGSGYSVKNDIGTNNKSDISAGLGLKIDITAVDGSGAITAASINTSSGAAASGRDYNINDIIEVVDGTNKTATITITDAHTDCILEVSSITSQTHADDTLYNYNSNLDSMILRRERAYLARDVNFITRNNDPQNLGVGKAGIPQTGCVPETTAYRFTMTGTAGSNTVTITNSNGNATSVDWSNAINAINPAEDYDSSTNTYGVLHKSQVWNGQRTAAADNNGNQVLTLKPNIPWDVYITSIGSPSNGSSAPTTTSTVSVTLSAALNGDVTNEAVYIGRRSASFQSGPRHRWDHTTLAKETGGGIFFQVGPFSSGPVTGAPSGVPTGNIYAYYDTSTGVNSTAFGNRKWDTIRIFGEDLGTSNPDFRIQFGRTIGKMVGEYLFKVA